MLKNDNGSQFYNMMKESLEKDATTSLLYLMKDTRSSIIVIKVLYNKFYYTTNRPTWLSQ